MSSSMPPVPKLKDILVASRKRTRAEFGAMAAPDTSSPADILDEPVSQRAKLLSKYHSEYALVQTLPTAATAAPTQTRPAAQQQKQRQLAITSGSATPSASSSSAPSASTAGSTNALAVIPKPTTAQQQQQPFSNALVPLGQTRDIPPPQWHAPWKLFRVIAGHTGWVRSVAVDPSNEWFVTGGGDRLIKIWDMASGNLKLTLTGHISAVRGLAVSERHPYLFSAGEDKQLKNWDLETNKVIRQYHGHLSGIYSLALHPTLDILATGGRDSTIRLWDMRSKHQIHVLTGHQATIGTIFMQPSEFQLVSGSNDSTIKLWDIRAGKSMGTLTHHKKSVRALCAHPTESTFVSGSPDNIKQWVMTKEGLDASAEFPTVKFVQNFSGHQGIVNCLAANDEGVLFSGGDNGSMHFWDWRTGYNFQSMVSPVQPGSLESEAGIFAATFDRSGYRLITCEADKSIKMWKEDERASKDSHPIVWRPDLVRTRY